MRLKRARGRGGSAAPGKPRSVVIRLLKAFLWSVLTLILFSVVCVAALRWINPPITGVMLQRKFEAAASGAPTALTRRWCNLESMGEHLPRALIAAEDQRFVSHYGFDLVEIEKALDDARQGEGLRGASTISQQVAKNVFLTTHRSWLRKGLEVWFTVLVESLWSKQRILEVHLNVAEWGPQLFGACAASAHYFGLQPSTLSRRQAAQMVVTLPAPLTRRPDQLGGYSLGRVEWVLRQMPNVRLP